VRLHHLGGQLGGVFVDEHRVLGHGRPFVLVGSFYTFDTWWPAESTTAVSVFSSSTIQVPQTHRR
jgi:hypothetical protein